MSCVEASDEPGGKHQNDGVVLGDGNLPEGYGIFVEGRSMTLSEPKSNLSQFFSVPYLLDVEGASVVTPQGRDEYRRARR